MGIEEARQRRAQALLEAAFPGAEVVLELEPHEPASSAVLARSRRLVRSQVTGCRACPAYTGCRLPVPFSGPLRPSFAVVGDAPGADEDVRGTPFVGRAGKLFRRMLKEAGFTEDEMTFLHAVSCYPNDEGKTRGLYDAEMAACRHNLLDQLRAADTRFVLFAGATAFKAYRDDLPVSKAHGRVFLWESKRVVMPVHHPASVLRDNHLANAVIQDLKKWKDVVRGELDALTLTSDTCVRCEGWAEYMDPDGATYCTDHWKRYGDSWKAQRSKWTPTIQTPTTRQGSLI